MEEDQLKFIFFSQLFLNKLLNWRTSTRRRLNHLFLIVSASAHKYAACGKDAFIITRGLRPAVKRLDRLGKLLNYPPQCSISKLFLCLNIFLHAKKSKLKIVRSCYKYCYNCDLEENIYFLYSISILIYTKDILFYHWWKIIWISFLSE